MRRTPACRLAIAGEGLTPKLTISKAKVRVAHLTLQGPVHAKTLVSVLRSMFWRGSPLPAILVLLVSLGAAHAAGDAAVGKVSDVDGTAEVVSQGASAAAAKGAAVNMTDELKTGADGHLQVTFRDNTVLTLSENARVVIDRYVYDPDQGVGDVLLTTTEGAFRFATGKMKTLKEKNITVRRRSPRSACAAPNSGAARSTANTTSCSLLARSMSETRRAPWSSTSRASPR